MAHCEPILQIIAAMYDKIKYMKRSFIIVGVVILIVVLVYFLNRPSGEKNYPRAGKNIIAFGDSLVEGVGASAGKDFVSHLSQKINMPIINAGQSGDTTAMALARLNKDVLSQDPRIVIILLGGNDAIRRIPKEEVGKNLGAIIDQIQQKKAAVLLVGIQGGIFSDHYKKLFANLASEKKVFYVPNILEDIFGDPKLMSDSLHPNDQGYEIMAKRVEPTLRDILKQETP